MDCTFNSRRKFIIEKATSTMEILNMDPYIAVEEEVCTRDYCLKHLSSHLGTME